MDIALPSSQGLFINMQQALRYVEGKRMVLNKGVHQDLEDF